MRENNSFIDRGLNTLADEVIIDKHLDDGISTTKS